MNSDQAALIQYRITQAEGAFRQAEILFKYDEWNGVINRAYYSMFYAALALLLTKGLGASKHTGVLALIDREFVRPGKLPAELSMGFRDAFNQRQKADYAELTIIDKDKARQVFENAKQFLQFVIKMIDLK